jgi:lantibiotic modifying enzyme
MAIGGLALASKWFNNPEFIRIARVAAEYYYQHDFVQKGFTYGACSDIMQNADHETAAGLMTSLMALYEVTADMKWLEKSRNVANLLATWVTSYDYELLPNTELAQLGAKLAGAVWASTQNKHAAPGFCTSSGDPLFKIYRATGDRRYAELMRDVVHAHAEGIKPTGEITERLTYCDADSRGSRGDGSTGWCELNGVLMAMELPGIYLRTDRDELFVFDHLEATIVKRAASGVTLSITNPTKFPAVVSVLAETATQMRQPLGTTGFLSWPKVEVKAGETKTVRISPEGRMP